MNQPPKVLFFYQDFGAMGGIERWILQAAGGLRARGAIEPVVVCCLDTPFYHAIRQAGLTVYGLPARPWFARSFLRSLDIGTWRALGRIVQAEKPAIAHVHLGLLETLLLRRWGCALVYSFHGYGSLFSMQGVQSPIKKAFKALARFLFRYTARQVDALLFVSEAEQRRMHEEGYLDSPKAGRVLPNGVPVSRLQEQAAALDRAGIRRALGMPADVRCVSFVNRLDANKNPGDFIRLIGELSRDPALADVHFLLVGDGPLREAAWREAAHLPRVHLLGWQEDILPVYAASDLLISTARQEGFGLGVLSAMAVGLPVLAYANGGTRTLLDAPETSACLVPADDFPALVAKAKAVLAMSPDRRRELAQALRARAGLFDESRFLEGLMQIYDRLCPKVSVILPVYNGAETVARAAQSVLGQTYANLELLVVDDGSTDDTLNRLARIRDPRLRVLRQPNQGVAVARNLAFSHATGEYIGFVDADDVWLSGKLAREIALIRSLGNVECLVYSGYYAVDESDRLINLPPVRRQSGNLADAVLADEGIFLPSTALVHRAVYEAVGGFKPACYHEDRVFFIEACQRFPAFATGERLVRYRQSLSGRCRSVLADYNQAMAAELSIVDVLRGPLPAVKIRALHAAQLRHLMNRFLMYGYLPHARRVLDRWTAEFPGHSPFGGKKGLLARLSLASRINFLLAARLIVQSLIRWIPFAGGRHCKAVTAPSASRQPAPVIPVQQGA